MQDIKTYKTIFSNDESGRRIIVNLITDELSLITPTIINAKHRADLIA